MRLPSSLHAAACAALLFAPAAARAVDLRALPPGELPRDARLTPLKDLDGYFPFTPPVSREAWERRSEAVRRQILVAAGLWPMPEKTPLNPVIHGRIQRDGYTVEKVYFESMPGFFVTGNLYRPDGPGPHPAVLCPHGHWTDGRFMSASDADVRKALDTGAEQFENAARSPLQARCVQLARMGCVVFHYDMLGYADSVQFTYELAHKFAKQRPEMNAPENWGLFSPQAESHLQSVMGLQTWNGVRSLDFVASLPGVDASRLAVTGASGGGTQTMILAGIDPRVHAAFPAVMVSTAMQGGCTCENASLLRVDTGNVEFAALFAPKPMGMTAANDWTKEMATKGFPDLQKHWELLSAPQNVQLTALTQFPHNYNAPSRAAMYRWFNQHLGLQLDDARLQERDFQRLTREEMTVWDAAHPAPAGGEEFERALLRRWRDDAQRQIQKPDQFRKIAAPAVETLVGWTRPGLPERTHLRAFAAKVGDNSYHATVYTARNEAKGVELPMLTVRPPHSNGWTVLWLDSRGKAGLFDANTGELRPEVAELLDAGAWVVGVDLLLQGEFIAGGEAAPNQTRRVKNPREAGAYTFGYNRALLAQRAQDVLTALEWVQRPQTPTLPAVVALGDMGPVAAVAGALAGDRLKAAVIETGGFRFGNAADLWSPNFLPGGAKYGDLPGFLALGAPRPTCVLGESNPGELLDAAYSAALQRDPSAFTAKAETRSAVAMKWLKERFAQSVTR